MGSPKVQGSEATIIERILNDHDDTFAHDAIQASACHQYGETFAIHLPDSVLEMIEPKLPVFGSSWMVDDPSLRVYLKVAPRPRTEITIEMADLVQGRAR